MATPSPEIALGAELDKLIAIDKQRNEHEAALEDLKVQRATQVGRMEILAEQANVDLAEFVGEQLKAGRAEGPPPNRAARRAKPRKRAAPKR